MTYLAAAIIGRGNSQYILIAGKIQCRLTIS
jgi:hypothetical protein